MTTVLDDQEMFVWEPLELEDSLTTLAPMNPEEITLHRQIAEEQPNENNSVGAADKELSPFSPSHPSAPKFKTLEEEEGDEQRGKKNSQRRGGRWQVRMGFGGSSGSR